MEMPLLASIGNFMGVDTLLIFLFILIFFGAKRLPELARGLGQAIREFSKAKDDFQSEITRPPVEPPKELEHARTEESSAHATASTTEHATPAQTTGPAEPVVVPPSEDPHKSQPTTA